MGWPWRVMCLVSCVVVEGLEINFLRGSPDFFDAITMRLHQVTGVPTGAPRRQPQLAPHQVQHNYLVQPILPPASGRVLMFVCGVPLVLCFG